MQNPNWQQSALGRTQNLRGNNKQKIKNILSTSGAYHLENKVFNTAIL